MSVYIGVDPGFTGYLVAISGAGEIVSTLKMPRCGRSGPVDIAVVMEWLIDVKDGRAVVMLEGLVKPGGKMKGSKGTYQTQGANWGALRGMLIALGARFDTPPPRRWQQAICPGKGDTKARSIAACRRLFPDLDLTPGRKTKPDDNLADAACLAEYARRMFGGGS